MSRGIIDKTRKVPWRRVGWNAQYANVKLDSPQSLTIRFAIFVCDHCAFTEAAMLEDVAKTNVAVGMHRTTARRRKRKHSFYHNSVVGTVAVRRMKLKVSFGAPYTAQDLCQH